MKKFITTTLLVFGTTVSIYAQIYKGKADATTVSFFSKTPLEDIDATNKQATVVYKTTTGDFQVGMAMLGFKFPKALMEEHFNENYVESSKFPQCTFKGKVVETIDLTKDGEHKVTVKGTMTMHGVSKEVEIPGTITKKGNDIIIAANFKIKVADYGVKVPSLYVQNIAEFVDVKVNSVMEPYVKK